MFRQAIALPVLLLAMLFSVAPLPKEIREPTIEMVLPGTWRFDAYRSESKPPWGIGTLTICPSDSPIRYRTKHHDGDVPFMPIRYGTKHHEGDTPFNNRESG